MQTLKVIAAFGGWQVVLDANSIISIHFGAGQWICNYGSAYDAIVQEVKDPVIRAALLKQWAAHMESR